MIRLEALRAFVAVAEHGNIKDAAERLCRTPSALSMTLKQIEDRLGQPLFESDRKSSLTELGRLVRDTGQILVRDYDRAISLIEAHAQGRAGRLRLASVPSVVTMLLPQALRDFLARYPGVEVDLLDTNSTDVREMVETSQVDLGIASTPPPGLGLAFEPLFSDAFRLVCRADAAIAEGNGPVEWSALEGQELILNEPTRSLRSPAFQALAARARLSVRSVTSLFIMVQSGIGVTILPALATVNLPATLVSRPIEDPTCLRTVGLITRDGKLQGPLVKAFAQLFAPMARQQIAELGLNRPL